MIINLNDKMWDKINNGNIKVKDFIAYILENSNYKIHFKIKDIKGALIKENVYNQLSISQLYNDKEENVKKAYLKNNNLYLEF